MRGGPGEKQIELDRRMIGERIKRSKERLDKVKRQRSTQRRQRERSEHLQHLAGRLHQRRQVDAVQRAGEGARLCGRPAVRHARHHHAPALPAKAPGRVGRRCPTRSASSATCRTGWSRPSRPRCRRPPMPTCCCTWSTPPTRELAEQIAEVSACCTRSAPPTCRRCWCSTRSTRSRRPQRPRAAARHGRARRRRARCRASSSARVDGTGLDRLRASLIAGGRAAGGDLDADDPPHFGTSRRADSTTSADEHEPTAPTDCQRRYAMTFHLHRVA